MKLCKNSVNRQGGYQICGKEAHGYRNLRVKYPDWYCDSCAAQSLGMAGFFLKMTPEEEVVMEVMES